MAGKVVPELENVLHHDFCPWANPYVYWLKKPIGWVTLALLTSLLLGIYVSPQAFLAAAGIAGVALIGSLWPWISTLGISGNLTWNTQRSSEGQPIETTLTLVNRWPWPLWGFSLEIDPQMHPADWPTSKVSMKRIAPLSQTVFRWETIPRARGQYPSAGVTLHTAFPFGIWTSSRQILVPAPLLVWPHITRLVDVPSDLRCVQTGAGSICDRCGDDGDWTGVRPYRPGDSLRQVHWPQTARRDSLVVFERQASANPSVRIAFDAASALDATREERDAMVRLLASLCLHFQNHHWSVWASLEPQTNERISTTNRIAFLDRLALWRLADWQPEPFSETASAYPVTPDCLLVIRCNNSKTTTSRSLFEESPSPTAIFEVRTGPDDDAVSPGTSSPRTYELAIAGDWDAVVQNAWRDFCKGVSFRSSPGQTPSAVTSPVLTMATSNAEDILLANSNNVTTGGLP